MNEPAGLLTLNDVWQKAQNPIKASIGGTSYDTWFSHLQACETTPGVLTIQAPDEYFKNWIDERYRTLIERCLRTEAGRGIDIEFAVNSELLNKKTQQKLGQIVKSFSPRPWRKTRPSLTIPFLFTDPWVWVKRICCKPSPMKPGAKIQPLRFVTCPPSSSPMN